MHPDKFPHTYVLDLLGGVNSERGAKYANSNREALEKEYSLLMNILVERAEVLGGTKKIHKTD